MSRFRVRSALDLWPFLVLGTLAVVFILMLIFSRKAPVILSLDPAMAAPGEQVVISGDYFGRTEREGSLSLAGEIPPPSLIQSWTDQRIVFIVPEDASSGLVTVANSQGTSTGVLFTNTRSIPTVLQSAGKPGAPLLWAVVPSRPASGQMVTLNGRGFGSGDEAAVLVLRTGGPRGPVFELGPRDCAVWNDRVVAFRVPAGLGADTSVRLRTPRGESSEFSLPVSGPVALADPRTETVEFRMKTTVAGSRAMTLWGPVPQRSTGTSWALVSSDPGALEGSRPLAFSLAPTSGDRTVVYRLTLTTWARRWDGFSAGTVPPAAEAPTGSDVPLAEWRPAASALKALTAKWGLETPDPWVRIQRIQNSLVASFHESLVPPETASLSRTPAQILSSKILNSYEASSLALAIAAQSGIPGRLVAGLWLDPQNRWFSRTWTEVWVAGAGWVPWDVIDGAPGNLDNRHFAFQNEPPAPVRLVPRSKTLGPFAPGSLAAPSAEIAGVGAEPVILWEISRPEK